MMRQIITDWKSLSFTLKSKKYSDTRQLPLSSEDSYVIKTFSFYTIIVVHEIFAILKA